MTMSKRHTIREAIMDRTRAMGPCTVGGYIYEVRTQVSKTADGRDIDAMTKDEVETVVRKALAHLILIGWIERYEDTDAYEVGRRFNGTGV